MADNPNLLPHLADIYEPALPSSWQLALGHWLVLLLTLLLLAALARWLYRRWQHGAAKRAALAELAELDWQNPNAAAALNQLLKRLLRHYHPDDALLHASTEQWQRFLQQRLPAELPLPRLQALLYQAPATENLEQRQQWWQACQYLVSKLHPVHGFYNKVERADA